MTEPPHSECIVSSEDLETPQGVYDAVRFVVQFCDNSPAVVCGLASVLCDYLRLAPADLRGQAADRIIETIRADVRRSLT